MLNKPLLAEVTQQKWFANSITIFAVAVCDRLHFYSVDVPDHIHCFDGSSVEVSFGRLCSLFDAVGQCSMQLPGLHCM